MSKIENQYKTQTKIWLFTTKSGNNQNLGSFMHRPHWAIHLKGKDESAIDFMCLAMIDPMSSWFENVELPMVQHPTIPNNSIGLRAHTTKMKDPYFD